MARRRPRSSPVAPVTWRDGVHVTGTPIWCDARRRRDVCFVSAADRVGSADHGQLIATPATLALIGAGTGHLAVPVHRPFTLGTLRLELIPSGRGLGAAALFIDNAGRTVLSAGTIRVGGPEAAEVRACDAVVVAAPFGEERHRFESVSAIADRVTTWVKTEMQHKRVPVLVVDSALDGLEVAAQLAIRDVPLAGSRSLRDAVDRLADAALALRAPGREPAAVIRVATDKTRIANASPAIVSARAIDLGGNELRFAWPFAAGRAQLLAWIEDTRAREVFVTGPCAEAIATGIGARARVLGPPHQMDLFEAAR